MKFLLFAFDQYYPCGGMDDFVGWYDTEEAAAEEIKARRSDFAQIIRHEDMQIIADLDRYCSSPMRNPKYSWFYQDDIGDT